MRRLLAVAAEPGHRDHDRRARAACSAPPGLGFVVAVPDDAVVPLDAIFEFFVTVAAADYANYTALTLRPQPIVDVVDPADRHGIHRYKANVPVLSNLTGASRGHGCGKRLFLSQRVRQRRATPATASRRSCARAATCAS